MNTKDQSNLSIMQILQGYQLGEFTPSEIVCRYIERIKSDSTNCVVLTTFESALEEAKVSDEIFRLKKTSRKLEGIPFLSKMLFCIKDVETNACSEILRGYLPPYTATVIKRLQNEGAILLGQCNMDEFAMGSTNENSSYGRVLNPYSTPSRQLVPGGSSGGSAAAVACGLVPFAMGSDTGGSVRQPSSFCGTFGIKPTYGRCSRFGMIAFASSLDQPGIITANVKDAAIVLQVIAGYDEHDSTSSQSPVEDYTDSLEKSVRGLKVGVPREIEDMSGINEEVREHYEKVCRVLEDLGAIIVPISLENVNHSIPVYYSLASCEAASNLARYDGVRYGRCLPGADLNGQYVATRANLFGKEVKRRILIGNYFLSSERSSFYKSALRARELFVSDFQKAFAGVDVILTPTTPSFAFEFGSVTNPEEIYAGDIMTIPVNLAGICSSSLPVGFSRCGLPIGMQIIGNYFCEGLVFNLSRALEERLSFKSRVGSIF